MSLQLQHDSAAPARSEAALLWSCALLLAAFGVAALAFDAPLAGWVHRGNSPSLLNKTCGLSETMGHGAGVLLIAIVIAVLDPTNRRRLPRVFAAALGSGLLANVLKLALARTRPNHFDFDFQTGLESFGPWLPLLGNPSWNQGFPSSHAATAAGMAIVLSWLYPRGSMLFAVLAVLAGMQRVLEEAHFASDVLWGAAVGCAFAPLCMHTGRLARAFDRLEEPLLRAPFPPGDELRESEQHPRAA